ncbi:MarR family winged helix-turn-helix transcriptional regulator [Antrihabitans cavernicola]|uniref:MarR family transcriptional regulator n=1 Tax=Antrihabitans cavernicola TaxID=2495913 RepID=A0A5A7SHM2_9NOCA|nr:MarR family transcriptional regulator [Spelaeibacter cavernicola]KAA0024662.1 MarR family transcriptional regulator [Spelaeibacter cavernicola]
MSTAESESPRADLVQQVLTAGRTLSTAAVLFHTALAAKQGLIASDLKALDLIARNGPMTAGQLSEQSGLAPASITGLVGRLEAKGAARRVPHPGDGRKVLIEFNPQFAQDSLPLYDNLVRLLSDQCDDYDDAQLEVIAGYLTEAAARQLDATRMLAD